MLIKQAMGPLYFVLTCLQVLLIQFTHNLILVSLYGCKDQSETKQVAHDFMTMLITVNPCGHLHNMDIINAADSSLVI